MTESRALAVVRRCVGAATVAVLLGAAVAIGTGLGWPGSASSGRTPVSAVPSTPGGPSPGAPDSSPPVRTLSPMPSAPPSPTPTAPPTPTALQTPTPTAPTTPPPTPTPSPTPTGNAIPTQPGLVMTAHPLPDGSFDVREVVTLPAPATAVVLRPAPVRDAGSGFELLQPTATAVEVTAGGQPLAAPDGPVRDEVRLQWDVPTRELQLHYRLTQVSVVSPHSRPGRTLAALGSIVGQQPADASVQVVVTGHHVLSISCPQVPLADMACGAGAAPRFHTLHPLPFDRSQVLVQYDRPTRR